MAEPPPDPDRFDEAVRVLRRRVPLTDPEYRKLEAAERRRAIWVAGVTQARVVQDVLDALTRAVRDGTTLDEFKADVGAQLAESWGGEDASRLETIFRTNVMGAYNGGRYDVMSDPVVLEARPYRRFETAGDSRVSEDHEELDGTILPADDPFWQSHWPPLRPNCRCQVSPLTPEEAEAEGITDAAPKIAPAEGFGQPPTPEEPELDLSGFDPEVARIVRDRIE